ncbi:NOTCH2 [Branchiostoma lanceolatum]|uniref:NOTCH2 protein n=1 Tax=Branchiostoma lanceolatum TaxID=7740 RepID=A0A8J9ZN10_BRALA|nr:NOTCH2 [Branchiostoma lanceolatum]
MWTFLLLTMAVVPWPAQSQAGTFLVTYSGYDYFKVQASGPMTSANVKATCEAAGYVTPCPGDGTCKWSSDDCVVTGLTDCLNPMFEVSQVLCGDVPYRCPAFDGVYVFMVYDWTSGSACGVESGSQCTTGNNYNNRYAFCARDVYVCNNSPCQNGATCQSGTNSLTCRCTPGYTGAFCETDSDDCISAPCQNGATCQDGVNSFTCQCTPGYAGTLCETDIDECNSASCQNDATCQDGLNSFTCQCASGYTGTLCEDIDECFSAPCQNGATCLDEMNGFTCQCAPGYTGTLCETDIDFCASSPCLSGGTCVDRVNSYSCVCPKGHVGDKCETVPYAGGCLLFSSDAVSYSEASQECQNRGGHLADVKEAELQRLIADSIPTGSDVSPWIGLKLSPGVMTYADGSGASGQLQWSASEPTTSCDLCAYLDSSDDHRAKTASCAERHSYVCKSDPKPCQRNICYNNGVCSTCFNDSYTFCSCPDGYEGDLCNMDIDECSSNPCQNGGHCNNGVNSYFCHCTIGYGGINCQTDLDLCSEVVCPFNWQCQDEGNHFICLAGSTRLAGPYACSSASCPDGMYCKEEGPASFSCRAG